MSRNGQRESEVEGIEHAEPRAQSSMLWLESGQELAWWGGHGVLVPSRGASPPPPFLLPVGLGFGLKDRYLLTFTHRLTRIRRLIPFGSPATTAAFSQNLSFTHSVGIPSHYLCPTAAQSLIFQVPTHVFIPLHYGES